MADTFAPACDSSVLTEFFAKAQAGPRRGFQWISPTLLSNALVLHYTRSAAAAQSIASDGFNVGAHVEMSHNTRRVTGRPTEQGRLVYGYISAKRGFADRCDFVVLLAPEAVEAHNVGDGNIQTVVDRFSVCVLFIGRNNSVHGLFDSEWQTRESWHLQTPDGQVVFDGAPWKHIKSFLARIANVALPVDATTMESLESAGLESPGEPGDSIPRG